MFGLFKLRWLRRFMRRRMSPLPEDTAAVWKRRFALLYMLIGFNSFIYVSYLVFHGRGDWVKTHGLKSEEDEMLSPAQQFAKSLNVKNAKLVRISGFKKEAYTLKDGDIVNEENEV